MALLAEIAMGAKHCPDILIVELYQKHQQCQCVVKPANEQKTPVVVQRHILIEQEQIVPEIQICFSRIRRRQTASSEVTHRRLRNHLDVVAHAVDAPAQVDFLHMGKEILIETASPEIYLAADKQGSSGGPENACNIIVLTMVALNGIEHTPATERIAMTVDKSA